MQRHAAWFSDAISDDTLEFGRERKHGAKDFSDRREVVVGDPAAEAEKMIVENRGGIDDGEEVLGLHFRLAIVQLDEDAHQALLAERDEDASADDGSHAIGH